MFMYDLLCYFIPCYGELTSLNVQLQKFVCILTNSQTEKEIYMKICV